MAGLLLIDDVSGKTPGGTRRSKQEGVIPAKAGTHEHRGTK